MKRISPNSLTCSLKVLAFFLLFIISPFCRLSLAAVITVPGDYATIQAAIDAANDADEIIVSPGTYYENIYFGGKNIILRSTNPTSPTVVASTIIDGSQEGSVVTFAGTELSSCLLSGFTITNGYALNGAGIYGNGSLAAINNNSISGNSAIEEYNYGGGGLYQCDGRILNNTISGNSAYWGGGLYQCHGIIKNNNISGNLGLSKGGGFAYCNATILNNIISENTAEWGGGLFSCDGSILNNTIVGNSADYGGGLVRCNGTILNNTVSANSAFHGGGVYECRGLIMNCIIWANSATRASQLYYCSTPFYSCIQGWTGGGTGNISTNPKLSGNYHLQPGSPCIDAGSTYYLFGEYIGDIDRECRVIGSAVDMGSDEYDSSLDTDGDLLADDDETSYGCNLINRDTDGDGLSDGVEVLRGTDPALYDTPTSISIPAEYPFIQEALFLAFPSEVVTLLPSTYLENLHFLGKNITLQSINPLDDDIVSSTTIDGRKLFSVMFFEGTENETCVVRGLTIRNGSAHYGSGLCGNGTLATIERNNITSNTSHSLYFGVSGAGLYRCDGLIQNNTISGNSAIGEYGYGGGLTQCHGTIQNNTIIGNSADWGGGLRECNGTIQNNTISGNSASRNGGGLYNCNGTIQNNIIIGNFAERGGGLFYCSGTIQNNTVYGNSAQNNGGGLNSCNGTIQNNTIFGNSAEAGGGLAYCRTLIVNCIIWGNSASYMGNQLYNCSTPLYSCIQDWTSGGLSNISSDPRFVDSSNGDFHLQPGSPCIDAGNIYYYSGEYITDIDGECRLAGVCVDIGCDEYNSSLDIDGDLLADDDETTIGCRINIPDTDRDGLCDGAEVLRGTNPALYNTPPGISIPAEYSYIQQAIFMAFPLEVITLSPGTYKENPYLLGKNITLQSVNPLDDNFVNATVIDGDQLFTVIFFRGTEDETCFVRGLTIRNGNRGVHGGVVNPGTSATIEYNKILDNTSYGLYNCDGLIRNNTISGNSGSGLWGCDGLILNNIISDNSSINGGGLRECDGIIQNNIISYNSAQDDGGGLYECEGTIQNNIISGNLAISIDQDSHGGALSRCFGTIQNNVITGNSADHGGGLSKCTIGMIQNNVITGNSANSGGGLYSCDYSTIQNNIIYGNSASDSGGGLYSCMYATIQNNTIYSNWAREGGGLAWCKYTTIRNCIIWQNSAYLGAQLYASETPTYSCIQDWTGSGEGNISDDPQLVDPDNGNFHLLPKSPCIDAGAYIDGLTEDFKGDPRPYDGISESRGDGSDYDIGADEFTGVILLKDYNFDRTNEGWTSVTLSAYFTPPECYYLPGYIILSAQDNTNTYGFWTSEPDAVPVIADCLYRANWTVVTDVTDPLAVPHMQLRVNSQNFQQADILVVSSAGDGSYAPTPDGRTYEMYFVPPESALGKPEDQDDLILSFDILNFNPGDAADGSLLLDRIVVDAIPLETLDAPTLLKAWSFDTDAEGWQFVSAPILFTPPTSNINSGALWLTAQNNTNTFGFWSGPSEEVQVEEGKLYRLRFTVSTDVTIQEEVPQLRLRASSEDFQSSIIKVINSVTGAEMSPTPAGRTYDLYFYPPQSLVGTNADSILTAFDMLNFDPADTSNGSLILDSVAVESLNIP